VERGRSRKRKNERASGRGGGQGRGGESGHATSKDEERAGSDSKGRDGGGRRRSTAAEGTKSERSGGRSEAGKTGSDDERSGRKRNKKQSEQTPAKEATVEEVSAQVGSFLTGLTEAFGFGDGAEVVDDGSGGVIGRIRGRHGLLVGPRGRTLEAVQELTRVAAQRTTPSDIRIKVDVGDYRELRADALRAFAEDTARAAIADGRQRSLEPMSSIDRKIVHDALNDMEGIETRSAGADPRRRVVIVPVVDASEVGPAEGTSNGGGALVAGDDESEAASSGADEAGGAEVGSARDEGAAATGGEVAEDVERGVESDAVAE
jgi:spoIIIJ-associated protein